MISDPKKKQKQTKTSKTKQKATYFYIILAYPQDYVFLHYTSLPTGLRTINLTTELIITVLYKIFYVVASIVMECPTNTLSHTFLSPQADLWWTPATSPTWPSPSTAATATTSAATSGPPSPPCAVPGCTTRWLCWRASSTPWAAKVPLLWPLKTTGQYHTVQVRSIGGR